jgi:hypothetical protein
MLIAWGSRSLESRCIDVRYRISGEYQPVTISLTYTGGWIRKVGEAWTTACTGNVHPDDYRKVANLQADYDQTFRETLNRL